MQFRIFFPFLLHIFLGWFHLAVKVKRVNKLVNWLVLVFVWRRKNEDVDHLIFCIFLLAFKGLYRIGVKNRQFFGGMTTTWPVRIWNERGQFNNDSKHIIITLFTLTLKTSIKNGNKSELTPCKKITKGYYSFLKGLASYKTEKNRFKEVNPLN